ncbi:MAG: winged helix-turn-helix transcriptional regulator [Komarekiella atlantica HA4396-MV6]|nr:winged helix-turn-helix transcriptional regulator [Komarekiella atlantica HA4396-MV6]
MAIEPTPAAPAWIKKVLNKRLSDLINFGIVEKISYSEIPPRVEYKLTAFGLKFIILLDLIDSLESCRPNNT